MSRAKSRARIARRALLVAMLCIGAGAAVAMLLQTRPAPGPTAEQSQEELRVATEAVGTAVRERLLRLGGELRALAGDLDPEAARALDAGDPRLAALRGHLVSLALAPQRGPYEVVLGAEPHPPDLGAREIEHLRGGRTLLLTAPAGAASRVYLLQAVGSGARLIGEVSLEHLFEDLLALEADGTRDFCVLDAGHRPILCSLPGKRVGTARAAVALGASGHFAWQDPDDRDHLAAYASVPLATELQHPRWAVVLSREHRQIAPAVPVDGHAAVYPILVLVSIALVALLGIDLIRRPGVPLEEIQELTRRIAEGRFDVDIETRPGDEFEELAASFRSMAARLKLQFEKLEKLIDVERSVLSAIEVPGVAEQVVGRIRDLYPCEGAAVALLHPEDPESLMLVLSPGPDRGSQRFVLPGFDAEQRRTLSLQSDGFHVDRDTGMPHYLVPMEQAGIHHVTVLPIQVGDELVGALAVGHRDAESRDVVQFPYARALARQAGVAFANIRTIEENRALAYYDRLTGLPNRLLFRERLEQALARARRMDHRVGLLLLDLDYFKRINDTFGHDLGDQLLVRVGERFAQGVRGATVARLGGDEFGIVLPDLRNFDQAALTARSCLRELAEPFEISGQEVFVSASVGIAVFPEDAVEAEALVKNADAAMYHAKDRGRNAFRFYASSMNEAATQRLALESDLRRAIEREELRLYFQPIVDIGRLEVIGMEALLRWQHPEHGMIGPDVFVPIAEDTGLIVAIGEWALRTACLCNRGWRDAGFPSLRVSVNISSRQFQEGDLMRTVKRALVESGMYPQNLGLELTERLMMNADEETLETLDGFRNLGARLSIDDFGTGYSSLAYLKNFPVDSLKIDRSFVHDVTTHADNAAIVQAIIAMAHGLNLFVVAEGVETRDQLEFLAEHGCDAAQGTFFSEPLATDGFEKLLRDWER